MAYKAHATPGTQLKVKIAAVATLIKGVEGLAGPGGAKSQIEYTALDDTTAKWTSGLPDYGTVKFNLFWDPADTVHQYLKTAYDTANKQEEFEITLVNPEASVIAFNGEVVNFGFSAQKNNVYIIDVEIKVSGPATVTV